MNQPIENIRSSEDSSSLDTLYATLNAITLYLNGGKLDDFKLNQEQYDKHPIKLFRDYKVIAMNNESIQFNENESLQSKVANIIDLVRKGRFVSEKEIEKLANEKSLYSFLERLCQLEFDQARVILSVFDDMTSKKLIFGGVALAVIPTVALLLLDPAVLNAAQLVKEVLTLAMGLPIVSMAFGGIIALYSLYENHFDKKKSFRERFFNNCYILASSALNITAHGILLASAAVLAPVSAALTTLASFLEVAKQGTIYAQYLMKRKKSKNDYQLSAEDAAISPQGIRDQYNLAKHRNLFIMNVTTAALLVAVAAAWAFVPGGAVVTVAAITAIVAIRLTKFIATKAYHKHHRKALQDALKAVASEPQLSTEVAPEETLTADQALEATVTQAPTVEPTRAAEIEKEVGFARVEAEEELSFLEKIGSPVSSSSGSFASPSTVSLHGSDISSQELSDSEDAGVPQRVSEQVAARVSETPCTLFARSLHVQKAQELKEEKTTAPSTI